MAIFPSVQYILRLSQIISGNNLYRAYHNYSTFVTKSFSCMQKKSLNDTDRNQRLFIRLCNLLCQKRTLNEVSKKYMNTSYGKYLKN